MDSQIGSGSLLGQTEPWIDVTLCEYMTAILCLVFELCVLMQRQNDNTLLTRLQGNKQNIAKNIEIHNMLTIIYLYIYFYNFQNNLAIFVIFGITNNS